MLPTIAPYELPGASEVPPNRVNWEIDPSRSALLIHDMQQYFMDAFGEHSALIAQVIENISSIREAAKRAGIPVYYTAQPPNQDPVDRALLIDFWGPGMTDDGREKIIGKLAPSDDDHVLTKWRYDAFTRSDFEAQLKAQGRDQILITGVYAHIGCLVTATSAYMRDIQSFLVADALADFSRDEHMSALRYASSRCGVVTDTNRVLSTLDVVVARGEHDNA